MKGNPTIITLLNARLSEELAAINQYKAHLGVVENIGYTKLVASIQERLDDEQKHAKAIIDRIYFLEGVPIVDSLAPIKMGNDIPEILQNDLSSETEAVVNYNDSIVTATELKDDITRKLFEDNLADETDHVNYIEGQLLQIEQMGIQVFLGAQL
jgi:bacterioferritin